jgi:hypothetical protein
MKSLNRQTGLTAISTVLLLLIGAFFVLITLKLAPIYIEHYKVRTHLSRIQNDTQMKTMSVDAIIERLFKRFDIDDVDDVTHDNVTVEQEDNELILHVDYEVRTHTLGNIDMVASFSDKAVIPR